VTATRPRVDASTLTFADLDAVTVGTTIAWNGQDARYGEWFSALERHAPPNLIGVAGIGGDVELLQYQPNRRYRLVGTMAAGGGSVADVLHRLDALVAAPHAVRFAAGRELDAAGDREVPAVALWTELKW
jgi:hypothetical protein